MLSRGTRSVRASTNTPGRKWIDERIEQLDPETDYVEIVRLSTLYRINDLQMHWFYTVGTAASATAPPVQYAVWREGTGKYHTQPGKRRDDSNDHMMLWFEHGPDSPATRKSIEMVNKYHAHYAKQYPAGFSDADDYIYILCVNATLVHGAMRLMGLPGFTAKQQRAMHRFWSGLAEQFTIPATGRPVTETTAFPADFAEMEAFVADYDARPWPVNPEGHVMTTAAAEHFVARWFPRPLHFFGRALVTSFLTPTIVRVHSIQTPAPPLAWIARNFMKTMMLLDTHVLPDPKESLPDRRRRLASQGETKPSVVDTAVHRGLGKKHATEADMAPASACPHLSMSS